MEAWGTASLENESAADWFLVVQEDPDPGAIIAAAISSANELEIEPARGDRRRRTVCQLRGPRPGR